MRYYWRVLPRQRLVASTLRPDRSLTLRSDFCDAYLTHDSASVRKQHNTGFKHKSNVRNYYQQFLDVHMAQFAPAGLPYPGGPPGFPQQARMPLDGTAGLRPLGGPPPGMPFPMGGAPPGYPQPAAFRAPPPFAAAGPPPGYGPPPGWQPPGLPPGMLPPRP